jgi:uncharacterized membrane protein YidH (DUF202 family)
MNKVLYKILAFIFGLLTLGAFLEMFRIITSDAPDIAPQRTYLIIMSLTMLVIMLSLTRYFFKKGKD